MIILIIITIVVIIILISIDRTYIFAPGRMETDVDRCGVGLPTVHDRSIFTGHISQLIL